MCCSDSKHPFTSQSWLEQNLGSQFIYVDPTDWYAPTAWYTDVLSGLKTSVYVTVLTSDRTQLTIRPSLHPHSLSLSHFLSITQTTPRSKIATTETPALDISCMKDSGPFSTLLTAVPEPRPALMSGIGATLPLTKTEMHVSPRLPREI
jgi:hypothetical protein